MATLSLKQLLYNIISCSQLNHILFIRFASFPFEFVMYKGNALGLKAKTCIKHNSGKLKYI